MVAAGRTAWALLLGAGLGLWYGFLRPLRRRFLQWADLLFLLGCGWGWLWLAFGVCGGDLRMGYLAGTFLGAIGIDRTLGPVLAGIWEGFWRFTGLILRKTVNPLKNIFIFAKKVFASAEKWVTIK